MAEERGGESRSSVTPLRPPQRVGKSIADGVMYTEATAAGDVEIRIWTPGSDEERTEIQRCERAAKRIDWGVPGPHEVRREPVPRTKPREARAAGAREAGPWDAVFDRIALRTDDESVPLPTAEDLAAFEAESGFTLSASYRAFVLRFGPGRFDNNAEITVASPGYPKDLTWHDLARLNRYYGFARRNDQELASMYPDEDLDRVRGLVVFGNDKGGDAYAFDRRDATDPARHECGICHLPRHGPPKRVATSFDGFVLKYGLGRKKSVAFRANTLSHGRDHDVARAFLDDTGWPLRHGQGVGDFAQGLPGVMHCSPRGELARAFRAWRKAHRKSKGGLL